MQAMNPAKPVTIDQHPARRQDAAEVSVVLPVYNESDVLDHLYRRLTRTLTAWGVTYELLFVDDGSTDGTPEILYELAMRDPAVRPSSFSNNRGKEAALRSGLSRSVGQAVIIMDADLQDPPELISRMLITWRHGAEAVWMRPLLAGTSTSSRLRRRLIDYCLKFIAGADLPEHRVDFMLYDRKVLTALNLTTDRKRYMGAIFSWMGVRQAVINYERGTRIASTSKKFTLRPQKKRPCSLTIR